MRGAGSAIPKPEVARFRGRFAINRLAVINTAASAGEEGRCSASHFIRTAANLDVEKSVLKGKPAGDAPQPMAGFQAFKEPEISQYSVPRAQGSPRGP